jgi:hypothetical protein
LTGLEDEEIEATRKYVEQKNVYVIKEATF